MLGDRVKELENELKVKEKSILKLKMQLRNEKRESKEREGALLVQFEEVKEREEVLMTRLDRCYRK